MDFARAAVLLHLSLILKSEACLDISRRAEGS